MAKRVYELSDASDATRVLVDRIWPRGLTKEHASRGPASGPGLAMTRNRWREFQTRYFEELRANHAAVDHLTDLVSAGKVTLLFGAHDIEHNNAAALAAN